MKQVLLIGAGGHAKVVIELLKKLADIRIVGLIDKDLNKTGKTLLDVPIIGTDDQLAAGFAADTYALITVGSIGDNTLRKKLYCDLKHLSFRLINAIHPTAIISGYTRFGEGNTLMAGALIGPDTVLGSNIIVNTGSIIEHDCFIDDHAHIAPGARLSGEVRVGAGSHIGVGATIIQSVTIGKNCLIGAGAVIIRDIPDNAVVVGNPGQVIKFR